MKAEVGKRITIDQLAIMMGTSFERLEGKIKEAKDELRAEMREGLGELRSEMYEGFSKIRGEMNDGFSEVNSRMDIMEEYKDLPEGKRFNRHETRISRLEDDMRIVKTKLGK